jgi:hypothetical protein
VTHVSAALRAGMPGRRLSKQGNRAFAFLFPTPCFSQEADQHFKARLAMLSCLEPTSRKAFCSLRTASRFQVVAPRSTLPAYFFDVRTGSQRTRSIHCSTTQPGLPQAGGHHRGEPVVQPASCTSHGFRISTPLRGFLRPLRIAAFDSPAERKLTSVSGPISLGFPSAFRF